MYHRYFGLNEAPFSIAVDPRYLFMSQRHKDALAHLLYGVGVGGGFIMLTGEVGTGKTTVNRCVLEQLPETTDIALVLNPALNAVELLATVCDELGITYNEGEQSLKVLTDKLHQFLLANHGRGHNTVLLIDEAQHLTFEVLEQIRLLTNLETNNKKLLQIILVGQPELQDLLARRELRQLSQRITARFQLKPLNLMETQAYINHRLQVAGLPAGQELFPLKAVKEIHKISGGIPRLINLLCDRTLLGTYGQNKNVVDVAMVRQAAKEVLGEEHIEPVADNRRLPAIAAAVFATLALGLWFYQQAQTPIAPVVATGTIERPEQQAVQTVAAPAVSMPQPEPVRTTKALDNGFASSDQAIGALLGSIAIEGLNSVSRCDTIIERGFACEVGVAQSWSELQSFNRPVVIKLITEARFERYLPLIGLNETTAFVIVDGEVESLPLVDIGGQWTGDYQFIWQPNNYETPVGPGSIGQVVTWVSQQFALIDGQATLLAEGRYNDRLNQRVKFFQTQMGLEADGIVGLKTMLKLNEQTGKAITLTTPVMTAEPQRDGSSSTGVISGEGV